MKMLAAVLVSLAAISTTLPSEEPFACMKIDSPEDKQKDYAPGSNCEVTGRLHLPKAQEGLILRTRLFSAQAGTFTIVNEEVKPLPHSGGAVSRFQAPITLPNQKGRYLLRVDCLDSKPKAPPYPKNLVATQSVFVDVGGLTTEAQPASSRKSGNTVTINSPNSTDSYSSSSNISVTGSSSGAGVTKIRIRFTHGSTNHQETTVNVTMQSWSGTLNNPSGGWPTGQSEIKAQGLNSSGEEVAGEDDVATISVP